MNPDKPLTPREELEIRLTAMLMGELPAEEAAALQGQIARDPELAALHARLRQAMELLREASAVRCLGTIVVKGRTKGVRVFELLDAPIDTEWQRRFMRAVVRFAKGDVGAAGAEFLALKEVRPQDGTCDFYLERIATGKTAWPLQMEDK